MKRRIAMAALTALSMILLITAVFAGPSPKQDGIKKIAGTGFFAEPGTCTDPEGQGADYALTMTGSLEGCHYVFVKSFQCTEGGAYRESGYEVFVGKYEGQNGTFKTDYLFTAKYLDCPNLTGEVTGRCQHPFQNGTGTGVFQNIREARLDMRDDVGAGNFPYKGHIQF
jgi:hypothetical protein